VTARALRPRATSAIAVAPVTVTDLTAPIIFGLEPRQFRDLVRLENIEHARVGQRVVVRVDDVLEALARITARQKVRGDDDTHIEQTSVESPADALLARIGRVRISGAGR
jgi:ligand-binding sensor domain-containing protein